MWNSTTLSVGILIVLALRVPVRRLAGARVAYLLWLIPPLGCLAWLAPARQVLVRLPAGAIEEVGADGVAGFVWPAEFLVAGWLLGLAAMVALFAFRQRRFATAAGTLQPVSALGRNVFEAAPTHGPAVVGALRPVIVLPKDFGSRFSCEEQALILAHERAHVERGDPLANAAALALRAVHWFNPLMHVAVQALRIDQELACDATVVERHGGGRRAYAEAMLKSHAAAFDAPVGCAWHSSAFHPMKERILMLRASPSRLSRHLGLSFVAVAALGVGSAVWLMRPVEVLAAPTNGLAQSDVDALDELGALDEIDAIDAVEDVDAEDIAEAKTEAQEAQIDAWQAARGARAAVARARVEAAVEARHAFREARAAVADARRAAATEVALAMASVKPAIEAARAAAMTARPAIAEAQRALDAARPAIAAAVRETRAAGAMAAQAEAKAWAKAQARLATACRRALARSSADVAADEELRVLKKLVCIPRGPGPATSAPN
jgi:beta-lactamase regulating signal transducer with metallopeptidase domain